MNKYDLRCPVCGCQFCSVNGFTSCPTCKLELKNVGDNDMRITLTQDTPIHIRESVYAIREFRTKMSSFMFGKSKLFDKDFRMKDVVFLEGGNDINIDDYHLLGACGVLTYHLSRNWLFTHRSNLALYCSQVTFKNVGDYLFYDACISTCIKEESRDDRLSNVIMLPFPEVMLSAIGTFKTPVLTVTDEQALLTIVTSSTLSMYKSGSSDCKEMLHKLLRHYLKSRFNIARENIEYPTVFINVVQESKCLFNIVNEETNSDMSTALLLYKLYCKYYGEYVQYFGYDAKVKWLREKGIPISESADVNVQKFWEKIYNTTFEEML